MHFVPNSQEIPISIDIRRGRNWSSTDISLKLVNVVTNLVFSCLASSLFFNIFISITNQKDILLNVSQLVDN